MRVGELVWVEWRCCQYDPVVGSALILKDEGYDFFWVLCMGKERLMHTDYMEPINESR
jgi:hypothetical protein